MRAPQRGAAMGFKRAGEEELSFNHAINVTPFIDVILVLLIIFMVAAPLSTGNVPVNLPAAAAQAEQRHDKPIYLTLQADGALYWNETALSFAALPQHLAAQGDTGADKSQMRIFIRADKNVDYGRVMELLNSLRQNGYRQVGLVGLAAQ